MFFRYWNLYAYLGAFKSFSSDLIYEMERITTKIFFLWCNNQMIKATFLKRLLLLQVSAVLICSGQILTLTHRPRWDAKYPFGKTPLTYCRCPKLKITVVRNRHAIRGKWKTNMLFTYMYFYTNYVIDATIDFFGKYFSLPILKSYQNSVGSL